MTQQLDVYKKGTAEYGDLQKRLQQTDQRLSLTQDELKILAYHFHIVQEDFSLELELQPHLIRLRADIETKMSELSTELDAKTCEKRRAQKQLVLLKANCEKMRDVLFRHSHVTSRDTPRASRESTRTSGDDVSGAAKRANDEKNRHPVTH